ncbi:MAG: hypothetical protein WAU36_06765 [Cyclobacteriaceae bacterium]
MELKEEQNLILRVTKYALNKKQFLLGEMKEELDLSVEDYSFVISTMTKHEQGSDSPNHILAISDFVWFDHPTIDVSRVDTNKSKYSLLPNAFYNYVDYLEIKEARKHADEAKKQSMLAIQLTIFAIIISIVIGIGDLLLNALNIIFNF